MPPSYTNDRKTRCCWINFKILNQLEWIIQSKFTQNRTGSWGLPYL